MIEVEQAIALLQAAVPAQTETIQVDLLNAAGRVLARDAVAPIAVPRFARSAMDGYALHSADTEGASVESPVPLRVIGELMAGDEASFAAAPGTAVRIMTGGAIPQGYDCVLRQEDSDCGEATVQVNRQMQPHENYSPAGEDLEKGDVAVPAHTRLSSHHIGILASMGLATVPVLRPLRVGLLATGNELAPPGTPLAPAQIYCSSIYALASHLKTAGVEVPFLDISPDDGDAFCRMVESRMDEVDVLLTTGGISVGKKDFIPTALDSLGAEPIFRRVNMKPGTPVLAASYKGKVILGLSGNPFAALVNFQVFFWPMLAKAMQNQGFAWRRRPAILRGGGMKQSGLRRFVRAFKNREGVHIYTKNHRSSVLSNLSASNCIIDQPANTTLREGDEVQILYWNH